MGIVVDSIETRSGLTVSNAYVSLGKSRVDIQPHPKGYRLQTYALVWKDEAARTADLFPVDSIKVATITDNVDDVYGALYKELASVYGAGKRA